MNPSTRLEDNVTRKKINSIIVDGCWRRGRDALAIVIRVIFLASFFACNCPPLFSVCHRFVFCCNSNGCANRLVGQSWSSSSCRLYFSQITWKTTCWHELQWYARCRVSLCLPLCYLSPLLCMIGFVNLIKVNKQNKTKQISSSSAAIRWIWSINWDGMMGCVLTPLGLLESWTLRHTI